MEYTPKQQYISDLIGNVLSKYDPQIKWDDIELCIYGPVSKESKKLLKARGFEYNKESKSYTRG